MIKIIDNQKRSTLSEGRSFGVGFAFLKKINNCNYETVQPISACKDYLNDVIYSEHTGKTCCAHGLNYSKHNLFEGQPYGYLAVSVLDYCGGQAYSKKLWEKEALDNGISSIQNILFFFERKFKMERRTKVLNIDDNLYLFKVPIEWCASSYMISLYSLLIRTGRWFKEGDVMDYLSNFTQFDHDVYLVRSAMKSINKLLETMKYKQDLFISGGGYNIHNAGILAYINANDLI